MGLQAWPGDPGTAAEQWDKAYQLYSAAHSLRMNYYPGINAASMAVLLGRDGMARHLASDVRGQCLPLAGEAEAGKAEDDPYWLASTLGEACLILLKLDEAVLWYNRAAALGRADGRFGDMGATLKQLRLLAGPLKLDPALVPRLFPMPRVAVFAGHMVDAAGRDPARFPETLVPRVKREIRAWLDLQDIEVGFASAACGSDLLFLEALLERGGEAHVILPYDEESYCRDSVAVSGKVCSDRFQHVLHGPNRAVVQQLSGRPLKFGEVAYDYASQILHGLAIMHAEQLSTELRRLAVWDGKPGEGPGGTTDVVNHWSRLGHPIDVIPVPEVQPATPLDRLGWTIPSPFAARAGARGTGPNAFGTQVVALLFADVVHFSRLDEQQIPIFVDEFLQMTADLLDRGGFSTEKRNTWGDGLYVVFDHIRDAAQFALDLCDGVKATDWAKKGLPATLGLRTALHAGPVYRCTDPVTRRPNCIGSHVSFTARLEPVTPPNEIYASQAFAALAVAEGLADFACRYVGHLHLPKNHGVYPIYHVTRSAVASPPSTAS